MLTLQQIVTKIIICDSYQLLILRRFTPISYDKLKLNYISGRSKQIPLLTISEMRPDDARRWQGPGVLAARRSSFGY
jgi:hypothetical protein